MHLKIVFFQVLPEIEKQKRFLNKIFILFNSWEQPQHNSHNNSSSIFWIKIGKGETFQQNQETTTDGKANSCGQCDQ